jgi:hypothetical protein
MGDVEKAEERGVCFPVSLEKVARCYSLNGRGALKKRKRKNDGSVVALED